MLKTTNIFSLLLIGVFALSSAFASQDCSEDFWNEATSDQLLDYEIDEETLNTVSCNDRGDTIFHLAARYTQDPSVIEMLITHGADANSINEDGETVLAYAADNDNQEVYQIILEAVENPTARLSCDRSNYKQYIFDVRKTQELISQTEQGCQLAGMDLSQANLKGAYLLKANLQGANLQGANLSKANLKGANLKGADLQGADLQGTFLIKANLKGRISIRRISKGRISLRRFSIRRISLRRISKGRISLRRFSIRRISLRRISKGRISKGRFS